MKTAKRNLFFLIGMPAAGKTTIGIRLAQKSNAVFWDTDQLIENESLMKINDIILNQGEEAFRVLESNQIKKLIFECKSNKLNIISCGGGLPCFNNNIYELLANGIVIYLKTDTQILLKHLLNEPSSNRPLIEYNTIEELKKSLDILYFKRKNCYEKAHYVIENVDNYEEIISQLYNIIKLHKS